jgi:hypothetical protein
MDRMRPLAVAAFSARRLPEGHSRYFRKRRVDPMFKRTALLVFLFALGCTAAMAQPNSFLGTWKCDIAKSTWIPGPPPRSNSVTWEVWKGGYRAIIDNVDAQGKATHHVITFKIDGIPHPVPHAGQPTTVTFSRMDHAFENVRRVNGKVTFATRRVVSRDGKTMIVRQTGTNTRGQTVNTRFVLIRQ